MIDPHGQDEPRPQGTRSPGLPTSAGPHAGQPWSPSQSPGGDSLAFSLGPYPLPTSESQGDPQFLVPSDRPSPGSCLGLLRPLVWSMRPLVATERMSFLPSGQSLLSTSLEQEWQVRPPEVDSQ